MRHAVSVFCAWLERTPLSHQLQTIEWVVPAIQTLHLLAIAALMGATGVLNLRLLGLAAADASLERVTRRFLPVVKVALAVLLTTGLVMIAAEPARSLLNTAFQWKMGLLATALLLTGVTMRALRRHPEDWQVSRRRRRLAGLSAVVSSGLWVAILCAGRWIAYVRVQ
ncbi:MAG: DUF6644 family protein [Myxococcaceae bacterium]